MSTGAPRRREVGRLNCRLDPSNLHPGEEHLVAQRLLEELGKAALSNDVIETPIDDLWLSRERAVPNWPD